MKRFIAIFITLTVLALCAGAAGASPAPGAGADAAGRLDLAVESILGSGGETQLKVTLSSTSVYSACEATVSFSGDLVAYAGYERSALTQSAAVTVTPRAGNVYLTCSEASGENAGEVLALLFSIVPGATGDATFAVTEGCVGVREGLEIPEAELGSPVSLELVNGSPVTAEAVISATPSEGALTVVFDGVPSAKWHIAAAAYSDGRMTDFASALSDGGTTQTLPLSVGTGETVRVFVLNSAEELAPVMEEFAA